MDRPRGRCRRAFLFSFTLGIVGLAAYFTATNPTSSSGEVKAEAAAGGPWRAIGAVHPRLSPDGQDVVFSYHGGIWRLALAGGTMRRLAAGVGFAVEPCWSPDGKRIAYLQGRIWGGGAVQLIDAQSGASLPLPGETIGNGKIAFSADGQRLVGHLRQGSQVEAIRSLDLQSGELKTLVRLRSPRPLPWALSADGKQLAVVTTMDIPEQQSGNDGPQADLWVQPSEDSEPRRITRFPARIYDLCWSADGRSLIVNTDLGNVHNDLWRIDLHEPERPAKLTMNQADEDRPSIAGDGRWLLHTDNHAGCVGLALRDLSSGDTQSIAIRKVDYGAPTGRVHLRARDRQTGQPIVARVALESKDGAAYAPPGSLWRVYRDYGHFHVAPETEFELPAGAYKLRAHHGLEYRPAALEFEVTAGAGKDIEISLERWANPNAKHWYGGDNHIHANYGYGEYYNTPATMADYCAGEGLNICNFMVANSDGDGVFDREFFRGRPDALSTARTQLYWNEEWRSTIWGHLTLVNLKHVVEPVFLGFKDTTNPWDVPTISDIADRTRRQGGVVNFTHPAARIDDLYRGAYTAKALPIYAALGKIDTMDAMGSNDRASSMLYQRLLNCGLRLTASAGTDCFLNRIRSMLPGSERVYVQTGGPLTYENWIAGLKAGRTFVTNGPMLDLTVNGRSIGDTVKLTAPGAVSVRATVSSGYPLERTEVLYNGKVVFTGTPAGTNEIIDTSIALDRSGWIALRVSGPAHPEIKGEGLFAHTSPVYVQVAGTTAGSADDARYFLAWIDRLWKTIEERDLIPDAALKEAVRKEVEQARMVYRKLLNTAGGKD